MLGHINKIEKCDVFGVYACLEKWHKVHSKNGYKPSNIKLSSYNYYLQDGSEILVYWKNGWLVEELVKMS